MSNLTVFKQMKSSPAELFRVLRQEIGVKCTCLPFAVKTIKALDSLDKKLSENDAIKAADTFLSNLQTLTQGGIVAEDYDKIDMVKRGGVITISARVEAFLRAAARKGYRITDTIVAVPKEDANSTYYEENFHNGEVVYILKDKRIQGNRKITAERLASGYFDKFICRLDVTEIKSNKRLVMTVCEMSNEDVLNAAAASDNGIYRSKWEKYINEFGYEKNRRVITKDFNIESIWCKWTGEMVAKTVIRRALKRVKEVLPELKETIYAFDNDDVQYEQKGEQLQEPVIDILLENYNVDLNNLTEQQKEEVSEMFNLFAANPKLAADKANEIIEMFNGNNLQEIINIHYASIANIKNSKKLYPVIAPLFETLVIEAKEGLYCVECGKEITSEKSKKYYSEHPNHTVKCFDCNKKGKS